MTEVVADQTPPILKGPSDKEKKYDRQLRLWGGQGQQALENAHILLVNSGSGVVGIETLKNLVLPGIGKFTILDTETVSETDLGVNFFLDEDCLGQPRAEACTALLRELNPDVEGEGHLLEKDGLSGYLQDHHLYTLILFSYPIDPTSLSRIEEYGKKHRIPLVSMHSSGFYSYFRIILPGSFPIVDTHPDSTATTDLRLLTPWPELSQFAAGLTKDIDSLDAHAHGHIPYIAILLHYLKIWKDENGSFPSTYKEKTLFREKVSSAMRTDTPEGGEENFEEAIAAVLKTVSVPALPGSVKEVFDYEPAEIDADSNFWIIAKAVKAFYAQHNQLPLPGSVPDMKAQSTTYVQLQNIYKAKARQDVAEVIKMVRTHPHGKEIDAGEVETFCKNAAFIKLIRGPDASPQSLGEIARKEFRSDEEAAAWGGPLSLFPIYLALRATSHESSMMVADILSEVDASIPDVTSNEHLKKVVEEVARAQGGELHNISSLTGGMTSQEIIKIITKQYIPIDNTCVFDGITSRAQIFRT
ncbi:NEDD8-activating enzyme E1 regulatory subunit [Coleophoma cylindrospora]|uniref:NEDD8-activating enzyme E1 regulatory subunit n=1 Tax=Coleophoma cylindrospora TaxID=1849047 RepID=A0A3D8R6I7_9HELO|nr:NEDD8-activating enzyme E1 regulatory subunit [Coleophoma cylindrospora]